MDFFLKFVVKNLGTHKVCHKKYQDPGLIFKRGFHSKIGSFSTHLTDFSKCWHYKSFVQPWYTHGLPRAPYWRFWPTFKYTCRLWVSLWVCWGCTKMGFDDDWKGWNSHTYISLGHWNQLKWAENDPILLLGPPLENGSRVLILLVVNFKGTQSLHSKFQKNPLMFIRKCAQISWPGPIYFAPFNTMSMVG